MPWLPPPRCRPGDVEGDIMAYLNQLWTYFREDFIESKPSFNGAPVGLMRAQSPDGKHQTFWHVVQTDNEGDGHRLYDPERASRVRWIRSLIEAAGRPDTNILCWVKKDRRGSRIHLTPPDLSYVVVIEERKGYYLLVTAYVVSYENRRDKIRRYLRENPCS